MASKLDLKIDQGTDYSNTIFLTDNNGDPINLSNCYANSLIKKWYTSANSVAFYTTVNATAGSIGLSLDKATATNLQAGRYVYDINLTNTFANTTVRIREGIITVSPSVTSGVFVVDENWFSNGYTNG